RPVQIHPLWSSEYYCHNLASLFLPHYLHDKHKASNHSKLQAFPSKYGTLFSMLNQKLTHPIENKQKDNIYFKVVNPHLRFDFPHVECYLKNQFSKCDFCSLNDKDSNNK
ncbi:hypothetical protein V8G54_035330, partial [Vigna mungo]